MSNHDNHRRGDIRRSEHGPRYENGDPGKGANSPNVARARASWKKLNTRRDRRRSSAPSVNPDEER